VGSVKALTEAGKHGSNAAGPAHWKRFIQSLQTIRVAEPQVSILKASESNESSNEEPSEADKTEQDLKIVHEASMSEPQLDDLGNLSKAKSITDIASIVPSLPDTSQSKLTTDNLQENKVEGYKGTRCGRFLNTTVIIRNKNILPC
jgi:hypothetical protein